MDKILAVDLNKYFLSPPQHGVRLPIEFDIFIIMEPTPNLTSQD
jgi:hypothetical protein